MSRVSPSRTFLRAALAICGGAQVAAAAPADAPVPGAAPQGLSSLRDDKPLMSELASRGLDSLLDRLFDVDKTPDEQRKGLRSLKALRELSDTSKPLTAAHRQMLVKQVTEGIRTTLPSLTDPVALQQYAATLLEYGVKRDVNTLEYWGLNPATQAQLKPVAQTVVDLLDKCSTEASTQADNVANQLHGPDDPRAKQWEQLDAMASSAKYKRNMAAYFLALATDASTPQGKADRNKVADEAIKYLTDLDNNDSQVQPVVRLMLGKLNYVKEDNKIATDLFTSIAQNPKNEIQPAPDPFQQYEARYFAALAQLQAGDAAAAKKGLNDLLTWQHGTMPTLLGQQKMAKAEVDDAQKGMDAAGEMLRYRISLLDADLAASPAEKKKAQDAGEAVLLKLSRDRKDLQPIIYEQLVSRMPADKSVVGMDPLLLQGLMGKGASERNRPETDKIDTKFIERAIAAAQEVQKRKSTMPPELVDDASLLIPSLLDRLHNKPLEAAKGYLDYAEGYASKNLPMATEALNRAGYLTYDLKKNQPDAAGVGPLYDRFLTIAVNKPFDHKELSYAYGKRLRGLGKNQEAVALFHQVPKTDPNYANAQYYELLTLKDMLESPKLSTTQRQQTIIDILKVAGEVRQIGANSTNPTDRTRAALATLNSAEITANDQHDPKKALQLLEGFEDMVKAFPAADQKQLLNGALFTRVNSQMAIGQLEQATGTLVKLLQQSKADEGIKLVHDLLEQLDKQFAKAEAANDRERMRDVATNEAKLTGFLSDWAKKNPEPKMQKFAYSYAVYDAKTKRVAGTLANDPATREHDLKAALAQYQNLASPEGVKLYQAQLDKAKVDAGQIDPSAPDTAVVFGTALTQYELHDYKDAQEILGDLVGNRKLGAPTTVVDEQGESKVVPNDSYWEATYKLYKCNVEMSKEPNANVNLNDVKRGLKGLFIRGGIPEKWQDGFEALRKELIPDFTVPSDNAATQPAVSQK